VIQLERHRPADDVGGAHHHGVLALERCADVLEQPNHPVRRAVAHERNALRQAADVVRMKTVDILRRVDALDDGRALDVFRQRQLHQDAVDPGIGAQRACERRAVARGSERAAALAPGSCYDVAAHLPLVARSGHGAVW
jgi:hypothetical protein